MGDGDAINRSKRSVIIEDEAVAARRLTKMLNEHPVNVLEQLNSVEEAIEWFKNNNDPHLIFLDIQLGDGISFEIFEEVQPKSAIIFTTAYDDYALKAFKLNSIDYLLKPVSEEDLLKALNKLKTLTQPSINQDLINLLRSQIKPKEANYKERFMIKVGQHIKSLASKDISAFYSLDKATFAFTADKRNYIVDYTLEHLEEILNPNLFFRINRNFILKIDAPIDIVAWSNSRLKIDLPGYDGDTIIVSRNKTKDFKEWLDGNG